MSDELDTTLKNDKYCVNISTFSILPLDVTTCQQTSSGVYTKVWKNYKKLKFKNNKKNKNNFILHRI